MFAAVPTWKLYNVTHRLKKKLFQNTANVSKNIENFLYASAMRAYIIGIQHLKDCLNVHIRAKQNYQKKGNFYVETRNHF